MNPKKAPALSGNTAPPPPKSIKQLEQIALYLALAEAKKKAEILDKMNSQF